MAWEKKVQGLKAFVSWDNWLRIVSIYSIPYEPAPF